MKTNNAIQKLILVTLTMIGTLTQSGCGPYSMYEGHGDESYNRNEYYEGNDYYNNNFDDEKEKLDPSTLSTSLKDENVSTGLCQNKRKEYLSFSDSLIYDAATTGKLANCVLSDAYTCESCACSAYVKVTTSMWSGQGWALNPDSEDSTGCVSRTQYPGYTPAMAGNNLTLNAVEQIRNALRHPQDVCGLCDATRPITVEMILE